MCTMWQKDHTLKLCGLGFLERFAEHEMLFEYLKASHESWA